jgi:hypothetical protein
MWFMADHTHSSRAVVTVRSGKGQPSIRHFEASTRASTAGIAYGQVVSFDLTSSATHRVVRCSTASGADPILSTSFAGVAAGPDPSDGSTGDSAYPLGPKRTIPVYIADADTEFVFPTKLVIASTMIGLGYDLSWDSTLSIHHVGVNSTAGDCRVFVTGFDPAKAGDTGGYVFGRFYSSATSPIVLNR